MSAYDRLLGVDEFGLRVRDSVPADVLAAILNEYRRGNLIRGVRNSLVYGMGELTGQGATSVINPLFTMEVDKTAVIVAHGETSKAISGVADAKGNTWTVDHTSNGNSGTDYISFASASITTNILASDNITITWTDATSGTIHYGLMEGAGLAVPPFVNASVSYQAEQDVSVQISVGEPSAVLVGMIHTNGGGAYTNLGGLEDATIQSVGDPETMLVTGAEYASGAVNLRGRWGSAGDGIAGLAVYGGQRDVAVPDLVVRELSSPLLLEEREALRNFTEQVDTVVDAVDWINELRDVMRLAERETPGYTDQAAIVTRFGV